MFVNKNFRFKTAFFSYIFQIILTQSLEYIFQEPYPIHNGYKIQEYIYNVISLRSVPILNSSQKKTTSIDVARLAGVSQATVSRVFSAPGSVTNETREKVLEAAEQLKYRPNAIARSLTSQKTGIIAIISNLESPLYVEVLSLCAKSLQEHGKQIMLFDPRADNSLDETIHRVLQYRVDGLVITTASFSSELSDECVLMGVPVVLFNRYIQHSKVNVVCSDNIGAGRMVASYLLEKNYQRFAYIGGRADSSTNRDRFRGYSDYMQQYGLNLCFSEDGEYTYEFGAEAMRRIMNSDCRPDAIFCASDLIAFGAIDTARYEFNLKIPNDIAFVGCDDTPVAAYPPYDLTTLHQPIEDMVQTVIDILLGYEDGDGIYPNSVIKVFTPQLTCRTSA